MCAKCTAAVTLRDFIYLLKFTNSLHNKTTPPPHPLRFFLSLCLFSISSQLYCYTASCCKSGAYESFVKIIYNRSPFFYTIFLYLWFQNFEIIGQNKTTVSEKSSNSIVDTYTHTHAHSLLEHNDMLNMVHGIATRNAIWLHCLEWVLWVPYTHT